MLPVGPLWNILSRAEPAKMIRDCRKFDQNFIHELCKNTVEKWEDKSRFN